MKKLFVCSVLFLTACGGSQHASFDSALVSYVANDKRETLTVKSTDIGENENVALFNAKKLAFQNLFFRGIPNSPFNKPMIGINEKEKFKANKAYLDTFFNQRMGTFITNSNESVSKVKGGRKMAKITLTINMLALEKDLEEHNVIKKFGL